MSILTDTEIHALVESYGLIQDYVPEQVSSVKGEKVISYGLSSMGYDLRIADHFKVFTPVHSVIVDPKSLAENAFVTVEGNGYCVIPPNSFVLGYSVEKFRFPNNVTGIVCGKSSYARVGVNCPMTPLEAGWEGHVTLEISNTTPLPAKIYANEGLCQVVFFRSDVPCAVSYADRGGKYMNQGAEVVLPRLKND